MRAKGLEVGWSKRCRRVCGQVRLQGVKLAPNKVEMHFAHLWVGFERVTNCLSFQRVKIKLEKRCKGPLCSDFILLPHQQRLQHFRSRVVPRAEIDPNLVAISSLIKAEL